MGSALAMMSGYNPLINYKWNTLPISDDYIANGKELIVNGNFNNGLNDWIISQSADGTVTLVNGEVRIYSEGTLAGIKQYILDGDGLYRVSFDVELIQGFMNVYDGVTATKVATSGSHILYLDLEGSYIQFKRRSSSTTTEFTLDNISVQKVIQEPDKRYLKDNGALPKYPAKSYFGRGMKLNGVDQSITIPIDATVNTIVYMKDGVLVYDEALQILTDYALDVSGVYQNFIAYNGIFTQQQKDYLRNYPETFLYYDEVTTNGATSYVKRSKILNQSELDNVVAHLPMCDTDEYTRDMVGYSKDTNVVDGDFVVKSGDEVATTVAITNGHKTSITTAGTYDTRPSVEYTYNTSYPNETIVEISFNYSVISGSVLLYGTHTGYSNSVNKELYGNGKYYGIFKQTENRGQIAIYISGKNICEVEITNVSVRKINSIYETTNYTTSVRDEAKLLPYGLQTSSWKRDTFGVPTALSQYLECDGVGAPTLAIDATDTDLWEKRNPELTFEIVMSRKVIAEKRYLLYAWDTVNNTGLMIMCNATWGEDVFVIYLFDGTSYNSVYANVTNEGFNHIVFKITEQEFSIMIDGVMIRSDTHSFVPSGLNFKDSNKQSFDGTMRLFKVHTKPQDPAKLYEDALNKGLLN